MAAIKELVETLAGGGSTSKRIRTDSMQYRCFMFTRGFVAPLRLLDKHPSELYIAGSYSRINSRYSCSHSYKEEQQATPVHSTTTRIGRIINFFRLVDAKEKTRERERERKSKIIQKVLVGRCR